MWFSCIWESWCLLKSSSLVQRSRASTEFTKGKCKQGSDLNCGSLAQQVLEEKNGSMWPRDCSYNILVKNVFFLSEGMESLYSGCPSCLWVCLLAQQEVWTVGRWLKCGSVWGLWTPHVAQFSSLLLSPSYYFLPRKVTHRQMWNSHYA